MRKLWLFGMVLALGMGTAHAAPTVTIVAAGLLSGPSAGCSAATAVELESQNGTFVYKSDFSPHTCLGGGTNTVISSAANNCSTWGITTGITQSGSTYTVTMSFSTLNGNGTFACSSTPLQTITAVMTVTSPTSVAFSETLKLGTLVVYSYSGSLLKLPV